MTFGPFAFQVLGPGFDKLGRDLSTPWTDIKVAETLDALQWLGPEKDEVTIRGAIFPEALGGLAMLDGIRAAAIAGVPHFLISLAGNVHGLFVVVGVSEDQTYYHDMRGRPRVDKYAIKLRAYHGATAGAVLGGAIRLFT